MTNIFGDIKRPIIFDGGFGSYLQERGLNENPVIYSLKAPKTVEDIHYEYLCAGADIITANTFGAYDYQYGNFAELIEAALKCARAAVARHGGGFVALDMGATVKLMPPMGDTPFEEVYNIFKQSAIAGEKFGADFVLIETMQDIAEARAAILAVKENTSLPVACTATFDEHGRMMSGADALSWLVSVEDLGVFAIGLNCGCGFAPVDEVISTFSQFSSIPIILQPNAGLPSIAEDGNAVYSVTPSEYAEKMRIYANNATNIRFFGGCCGTTPNHIKALKQALADVKFTSIKPKNHTIISSRSKALIFSSTQDKTPVLAADDISARVPQIAKAVADEDFDAIADVASELSETAAQALFLELTDSPSKIVSAVSELCTLPIFLSVASPSQIESVLREYVGKMVIYGVTADDDSMESVFPIISKYGAAVVCCCSKGGVYAETAAQRFELARIMLGKAATYNIKRKNIFIDPVSSQVFLNSLPNEVSQGLRTDITLDIIRSIELIESTLKVHTVLSVENVCGRLFPSWTLSIAFLNLAVQTGLSVISVSPFKTNFKSWGAAPNA